jgi:hypothetical protein
MPVHFTRGDGLNRRDASRVRCVCSAHRLFLLILVSAHEGVHGIEAYRATWPSFFEWQAQGASFEIVALVVAHEHHSFADTTG